MEGMVINNIKKAAELILLKDKEYEETEKLKNYFKRYVKLNNEIGILHDTLIDLYKNKQDVAVSKILNKELQRYLNILEGLEYQLLILHSKMNIANYDKLRECIEKLRNIRALGNDDYLINDLYNRMFELSSELEKIEWNLELMILNYGLQRFEIDEDMDNNNKDLIEYICNLIIEHLENDDKHESESEIKNESNENGH